ncbi:hypothetical protein PAMC26510_08640 [Caballeronia sordidicola]|uniref:Uncharacterized protein n=1 Tax=Caballeronia sordidicola TaxID=196367 RepID=A0A242N224_CABSO|nr:hypothetical protein PAMC26510_08640 [Caballeronia sordidicola]
MEGAMRRTRGFGGLSEGEGFWPGGWIIVEFAKAEFEAGLETGLAAAP